jgi:drug/metabolite transporter (DMT)-like permease
MEKFKFRGELWSIGAALGFVGANLFDKLGLGSGNPYAAILFKDGWTFLFAVVMALRGGLYYKSLSKKSPDYCGPKGWVPFLLSGPIMDAFGTVIFYVAISIGGLVIAVPCVQSQILWAAILSYFMLKEPLTRKILIGSIIFIAGLIFINIGPFIGTDIKIEGNAFLGAILAMLASLGWALGTVLWKLGMKNGCEKWVGLSIHYPVTFFVLFLYLLFTGNLNAYAMPVQSIFSFMGSGIFSGIIAVNLFMSSLRLISVAKANVIKSSYPILLSILAWLFFGEYLNVYMFIGIVLSCIGIAIVNVSKAAQVT